MTGRTEVPSRVDRTISALAWWVPELTAASTLAGLAWAMWCPLWVVSLALSARVGFDPLAQRVRLGLARRRARSAVGTSISRAGTEDEPARYTADAVETI